MHSALIGYTGYVGTTLLRQGCFEPGHLDLFRSTCIEEIKGRSYDLVVCSGAPAQKWIANKEPEADKKNIERLMSCLESVQAKSFVLISTVDVFKNPIGVDESSPVDEAGLHPYGLHRRMLERFVEARYAERLIVRLPGLVGPGLRKNVVYDLLHGNNLETVDSRGIFQFYPMVNLRCDIDVAWQSREPLVHLTAEPLSVAEVAELGFNKPFDLNHVFKEKLRGNEPARYDVRTRYAKGGYQYDKQASLLAIRAYAQSEVQANAAIHI